MNTEILEKLVEYIDAAIEEKMDDMQSSDQGLITSMRKSAERDIAVKPLIESLEETLSEMEALMRKHPAYRGGINIAQRARAVLSLQNASVQSQAERS